MKRFGLTLLLILLMNSVAYSQNYHGGVIDDFFNMSVEEIRLTSMNNEDVDDILDLNDSVRKDLGRPFIGGPAFGAIQRVRYNEYEYAFNNLDGKYTDVRTGLGSPNDIIILVLDDDHTRVIEVKIYLTIAVDIYTNREAIYSNLTRYYKESPERTLTDLGQEMFVWHYVGVLIHDPERLYKKEPLGNGFIALRYFRHE